MVALSKSLDMIDGNCIQTITHPAISVWSVAVCPETGDIVTGASDRVVRVFSRDQARWADEEGLKVLQNSILQFGWHEISLETYLLTLV